MNDHRVFSRRVEVLRLDDLGVQVRPIVGFKGQKLALDLGQIQGQGRHIGPARSPGSRRPLRISVTGGVEISEYWSTRY